MSLNYLFVEGDAVVEVLAEVESAIAGRADMIEGRANTARDSAAA